MAKIEEHQYSIQEAFNECFYVVPDYQREYVWKDKEVHQLLEDIEWLIPLTQVRLYVAGARDWKLDFGWSPSRC